MNSKKFFSVLVFSLLVLPLISFAQFKPLVGIPGINGAADFNTYINALYALSISIAALLAVIKIIIAGVKWMLSDVVTSKQEAKSDMQGALIGLLIVISAVLILNVINPQLTQTTLFVAPVDTVPKNNPGTNTPGNIPGTPGSVLPKATSDCVEKIEAGTGIKSFDCSAASKACTDAGGKVLPYKNWTGVEQLGKIVCSYGNDVTINCEVIQATETDPITFECIPAQASCTKQGGKGNLNSSGSAVICTIPY